MSRFSFLLSLFLLASFDYLRYREGTALGRLVVVSAAHVETFRAPTDGPQVKENLLVYSQHKFASNVVEKCLQYGTKEERGVLIQHLLYGHSEG